MRRHRLWRAFRTGTGRNHVVEPCAQSLSTILRWTGRMEMLRGSVFLPSSHRENEGLQLCGGCAQVLGCKRVVYYAESCVCGVGPSGPIAPGTRARRFMLCNGPEQWQQVAGEHIRPGRALCPLVASAMPFAVRAGPCRCGMDQTQTNTQTAITNETQIQRCHSPRPKGHALPPEPFVILGCSLASIICPQGGGVGVRWKGRGPGGGVRSG